MVKAHGKHVYIDYTGYQYDELNNGEKILEIMIQSTRVANIRPVFSHVEESLMVRAHLLGLQLWYF